MTLPQEINITTVFNHLLKTGEHDQYASSVARSGDPNIGQKTWQEAQEDAPAMLDLTEKEQKAYREHLKSYGAWSCDEIDEWSINDIKALLLQEISLFFFENTDAEGKLDIDWEQSMSIFKGDDEQFYFYAGE